MKDLPFLSFRELGEAIKHIPDEMLDQPVNLRMDNGHPTNGGVINLDGNVAGIIPNGD